VNREELLALLRQTASGDLTAAAAVERFAREPFESLGFATIDHHRSVRQGYPEVIYGAGKEPDQLVGIAERIVDRTGRFLATRLDERGQAALSSRWPDARVNPVARTASLLGARRLRTSGALLIATAGTSDLTVAEEAAETALAFGHEPSRLTDVGVAGIHRLLSRTAELRTARAIVVVAGMDGALPSVVGGLVACPVIAVPTSVGYGASFDGLAALLTMLNSCAAGVTVVNIDNGFGAAAAAARILDGDTTAASSVTERPA
jgi:hypothetical protein